MKQFTQKNLHSPEHFEALETNLRILVKQRNELLRVAQGALKNYESDAASYTDAAMKDIKEVKDYILTGKGFNIFFQPSRLAIVISKTATCHIQPFGTALPTVGGSNLRGRLEERSQDNGPPIGHNPSQQKSMKELLEEK